jgi:hypothetical protein
MESPLEFRSHPPGVPELIDRRKSARYVCESPLYLVPMGTNRQNAWSASLRDLSTKGIGLTLSRRFELGATLTIEWCPHAPAKLPNLLARVIRVFHMPDNTWWHGCELIGDIDSEELAAFLAASQATADAAARPSADDDTSTADIPLQEEHAWVHPAWAAVANLRRMNSDAAKESNARHKK